jgi:hypothetical protein
MREPYEPPSRQRIAEHVTGQLSGTANGDDDLDGIVRRREPPGDPLANFAIHLKARMRALGWDQAQLQKRAEVSAHVAAKAVNGTGCDLALAGKIAVLAGVDLAVMIGPYACGTCQGNGRAGFICRECGKEVPLG